MYNILLHCKEDIYVIVKTSMLTIITAIKAGKGHDEHLIKVNLVCLFSFSLHMFY